MRCPLLVILILTIATVSFGIIPKTKYEWKYVDFNWNSEKQKESAIKSGDYNASSCVLYDVDKTSGGRIFVTAVRDKGVPASLMTVSKKMGSGGPLLTPYPNWSWYNTGDCNGIISVYRVSIRCNRLFALDCGWIGDDQVCPPKLLIFDLESDMLIKRIFIPPNIASNKNGTGLLVTPLAYAPDCEYIDDVIVFMADIKGFGLIMYDNRNSDFCRIESDYMKPTNPNFTVNNESFYLEDGILGLAIINNYLYYTPLSGNSMYKMYIYNDKCSALKKIVDDKLTQLAGTLSGQTAAIASKQCAVFFSNIPKTSILCQDATKTFNSTNTELIAQDFETLQFISGMKITNDKKLMFLSNRFQRSYTDTLDLNETNFRILDMDISEIRKTTNCFASCKNNDNIPKHREHWHGGRWPGEHGRHWHGGRWPDEHGDHWSGEHNRHWPDEHDGHWRGRHW